jgi:hypothetical protein
MRTSLVALAATVTFVAAPAVAQSVSGNTTAVINGSIKAACTATSLASTAVIIPAASFSDDLNVGALSSVFTGSKGVAVTGTSALVTCNGAGSTISVDADPMQNKAAPTPPSGFSRSIDFLATVTAPGYAQSKAGSGVVATNLTSSTPTTSTVGLLASKLDISVSNAVAGGVLIAGTYEGQVTIGLTPGV